MGSSSLADSLAKVREVAGLYAEEVDRDARFPDEAVEALRAEGLLVPQAAERDFSIADIVEICTELGQACASTAAIYAMHQVMLACTERLLPEPVWKKTLSTSAWRKQPLLASSTTDSGSGDLRSSKNAIVHENGLFSLEKWASVISYGEQADAILVTARVNEHAAASEQELVFVPSDRCTLERRGTWSGMGLRGTCSHNFMLRAHLPDQSAIKASFGPISSEVMVPRSHLYWSAVWFGIALDAAKKTRDHLKAKARKDAQGTASAYRRYGSLIASMQSVWAEIIAVTDYLERLPTPPAFKELTRMTILVNNLKTTVSTKCVEIIDECIACSGMAGYVTGNPTNLERHLRDIQSSRIMVSNDRIDDNSSVLLQAISPEFSFKRRYNLP
ncbi:acyl-CoA/acyl-ACP dehydrogenase [Ensifer sp. IC4062]|nr:acyl-CoA dehydrogenase family protein [Ensifer sp. IC4062]MCA1441947.1 acyl-CoA/acyl-ACP dehydrogenase [Ensifer sp. IC4062]